MAASDELPRGLTLNVSTVGTNAVVTFPATPGVSWVLTEVHAIVFLTTTIGAGQVVTTTLPSGTGPLGVVGCASSGAGTTIEYDWSGEAAQAPGTALTVTLPIAAGMEGFLTATAFPT